MYVYTRIYFMATLVEKCWKLIYLLEYSYCDWHTCILLIYISLNSLYIFLSVSLSLLIYDSYIHMYICMSVWLRHVLCPTLSYHITIYENWKFLTSLVTCSLSLFLCILSIYLSFYIFVDWLIIIMIIYKYMIQCNAIYNSIAQVPLSFPLFWHFYFSLFVYICIGFALYTAKQAKIVIKKPGKLSQNMQLGQMEFTLTSH